jgi:hypothetical protein
VTDWRVTKRRYRDDRGIEEQDEVQPAKRKTSAEASLGPIDWKKLGLGFGGGDDQLRFHTDGKLVDGLAEVGRASRPTPLPSIRAPRYCS